MNTWAIIILSAFGATIYNQDPSETDAYLMKLHAPDSTFQARLEQVILDSQGTPYHDGPLGEGPGARYDADPLIDLGRVDCVTFVEQSVALASAPDLAQATKILQGYRYKDGQIDFLHRNHFLLVDWVPNNPWCKEITGDLGLETKNLTRTIRKSDFFRRVKAPELGQHIPDQNETVTYIPIEQASAVAQSLDKPALIVFIGHIDWLFALHCGIYVPGGAEGEKFVHASSKAGKVVATDLAAYAASQSERYLGMAVYMIEAPRSLHTAN